MQRLENMCLSKCGGGSPEWMSAPGPHYCVAFDPKRTLTLRSAAPVPAVSGWRSRRSADESRASNRQKPTRSPSWAPNSFPPSRPRVELTAALRLIAVNSCAAAPADTRPYVCLSPSMVQLLTIVGALV